MSKEDSHYALLCSIGPAGPDEIVSADYLRALRRWRADGMPRDDNVTFSVIEETEDQSTEGDDE